jgi:hypothetical protein
MTGRSLKPHSEGSTMFRILQKITLATVLTASIANFAQAQPAKDILWYGNSFTNATCCGGSVSVPNTFRLIAIAAGQTEPVNRNASADGQSLLYHRNSNTNVITTGIVPGGQWEHVVLQDFSTMPTHIGNLAQHLSSSLSLYQAVAAHSPNVVPVMYETWARGLGHSFYAGANPSFPGGPAQMQAELRAGYQQSTANINAAVGSDIALLAPVGDVWEWTGFAANMYAGDIYHANDRGTLLNALVLYATIYEDYTVSDIDLSTVLVNFNPDLTPAMGQSIADSVDAYFASVNIPEPSSVVMVLFAACGMLTRRR